MHELMKRRRSSTAGSRSWSGPVPEPHDDHVVVRVHGAGLNRADLLQLAGNYPAPAGSPPDIPGLEFAGVVEAVGPQAHGVEVGARVFGVAGGGAQAEYVVVPAAQCAPVPDGLDLVDDGRRARSVRDRGRRARHQGPAPGRRVGAGARGRLGRRHRRAPARYRARRAWCIGTARTQSKLDRCRALGLVHAIVPPLTDGELDVDALAWSIVEATDGGAHVTIDLAGGRYVEADIAAAVIQGRIVLVGVDRRHPGRRCPSTSVMAKRLTIIGTVLRARDAAEKAAATAGVRP